MGLGQLADSIAHDRPTHFQAEWLELHHRAVLPSPIERINQQVHTMLVAELDKPVGQARFAQGLQLGSHQFSTEEVPPA